MKPNKIILIRHAESEGNVDKTVYNRKPDYALALTEKGILQAQEAGKQLKELLEGEDAFFYISPFWRTRMTFEEIVASLDLSKINWREEPRLREQEWGHIRSTESNDLINEARDAYSTFYYRIPDGESGADVYDRVSDFLHTLHRDFQKPNYPRNTVIVSHGMTLRIFLMRWFHWTVEYFETIANLKNCEMVVLSTQEDNKYTINQELRKHSVYHHYQRPLQVKK